MNWIIQQYRANAWFRGIVQSIEGGVITGFLTATATGIDFSKNGLKVFGASIVGGVVVAVRNYLINRPGQPAMPKQ